MKLRKKEKQIFTFYLHKTIHLSYTQYLFYLGC